MPRFNVDDIAHQYHTLCGRITEARKPQHGLIAIHSLTLLASTHFGQLLQHAQQLQARVTEAETRFETLHSEHCDLQAQLFAALEGLDIPADDSEPRPPIAEAAGNTGESDDDTDYRPD